MEDNLTEKERKELLDLEEKNMRIIEDVDEKIRGDKKIQELIGEIKSHKWVKIIEGEE